MFVKIMICILFPFSYIYFNSANKILIDKDMIRYASPYRGGYPKIIYLLTKNKPFRSGFYFRIKEKNRIIKYVLNLCFPAPVTIEINGEIGGGLYIPHSFAIISVYKAGDNLSVLPGVVIGKKGKGDRIDSNPTIGNNCTVFANSTIFGGIEIGSNVKIGAGSVVMKNIPDNAIVVGNPAKILK